MSELAVSSDIVMHDRDVLESPRTMSRLSRGISTAPVPSLTRALSEFDQVPAPSRYAQDNHAAASAPLPLPPLAESLRSPAELKAARARALAAGQLQVTVLLSPAAAARHGAALLQLEQTYAPRGCAFHYVLATEADFAVLPGPHDAAHGSARPLRDADLRADPHAALVRYVQPSRNRPLFPFVTVFGGPAAEVVAQTGCAALFQQVLSDSVWIARCRQ